MAVIQHHVNYREIHGEDVIVTMEQAEHKKLHSRLRREGKCNIPVDELHKISNTAQSRTPKHRKQQKEYKKKYYRYLDFYDPLCRNVRHREHIKYNSRTGNPSFSFGFMINK